MSLVLYGVSADLMAAFEGLRESPGVNGIKYRQQDIDALAQMILCRNYGKATLELSYLLLAVSLREPGDTQQAWLNFFWLEESITPQRFRMAFGDVPVTAQSNLVLGDAGLSLVLPGLNFTLSPTRIAVLASLFEFIVHIDPTVLQQDALFEGEPDVAAVKTVATKFQALLYAYLSDHIQPAQQQRRFRHLWAWLTQYHQVNGGQEDLLINDAAVLLFWQQAALDCDDQLGFRRYRTVAENFFDLRTALQCVDIQQQTQAARVIGHDGDAGEISPDVLVQALDVAVTTEVDFSSLTGNYKFLTKQQADALLPIVEAGPTGLALPLTVMRTCCFGDWQAALVQALRRKKVEELASLLQALLAEDPRCYSDYMSSLDDLQHTLDEALQCGLYVLLHYRCQESAVLLIQHMPADVRQQVLQQLCQHLGIEVESVDQDTVADVAHALYQQWPTLQLQNPQFNQWAQTLHRAFNANNRKGFKRLPEQLDCEPYNTGVQVLIEVIERTKRFRCHIQELLVAAGEETKYTADLYIFREVFTSLYGDSV